MSTLVIAVACTIIALAFGALAVRQAIRDRVTARIEAATRLLDRRPASCGSCGASPVTYYAPDGHPACAECAPCDCGTEPCSKPDVVAARNATLDGPKEPTPDA